MDDNDGQDIYHLPSSAAW